MDIKMCVLMKLVTWRRTVCRGYVVEDGRSYITCK